MQMALATGPWSLAELDRLPDDSNTYQLVAGELFVTPAPSTAHEALSFVLLSLLVPYVGAQHAMRLDVSTCFEEALGTSSG